MDKVLELIHGTCVSLDDEHIRNCNEQIKLYIENHLISKMKNISILFDNLFNGIAFGGSYYDGLKVGKPDEFDLDIKLTLMKITCKTHRKKKCECIKISPSDAEGFLWFQVDRNFNDDLVKEKFIDDEGYMRNDKTLKTWFKGLVTKALNKIKDEFEETPLEFKSESGPALTLCFQSTFGFVDVDLVPAFTFREQYWPETFRRSTKDFLLVPKRIMEDTGQSYRYWRASFQEQEKILIEGKQKLKPSLRLLKKMRNSLKHKSISSYFLKTLVLWDIETKSFEWQPSLTLSDGFMHLVEEYIDSLYEEKIPYYWKEENNLLMRIPPITLQNIYGEVNSKFDDIKKDVSNPYPILKLILKEGTDEYNKVVEIMKENGTYNINNYISHPKMENILNDITSKYLQSEDEDIRLINSIIYGKLIPKMMRHNPEFKKLYRGKTFVDVNLFDSPIKYTFYIVLGCKCKSNCQCFTIWQELGKKKSRFLRLNSSDIFHFLGCWSHSDNNNYYIKTTNVLAWLSSCFQSSLTDSTDANFEIDVEYRPPVYVTMKEYQTDYFSNSGPSLTLQIHSGRKNILVDIAPAWKFSFIEVPLDTCPNPVSDRNDIFVIPRQTTSLDCNCEYDWWPSFYDQEEELLKNWQTLNKAFKLFKKSRNTLNHWSVSDYTLKTVLLWDTNGDKLRMNDSLSDIFMHLLQTYKNMLKKSKIPFYWCDRINLLEPHSYLISDYYETLEQGLKEVTEQHDEDPIVIAKFVLGEESPEYVDYLKSVDKQEFRNDINNSQCNVI